MAGRRRISWLLLFWEILRGVYPELVEGLRMTMRDSWMGTACCDPFWIEDGNYFMLSQ